MVYLCGGEYFNLGLIVKSVVLFPPPFYFFFISQTSYRTYKIISSYELARPVMGTIFLVVFMIKKLTTYQ